MASGAVLPNQILYLIIRFSASIPDIDLSIPSPKTTTTLSLKQLIRAHLPPSHSSARLRLIHAGKVLADTAPLSTSLKLPAPPPPRDRIHNEHGSKSKGKQPVKDEAEAEDRLPPNDGPKLYIHCSLGDTMSMSDLASEASSAEASEIALQKQYESSQPLQSRRRTSSGAISGGGVSERRRGSSNVASVAQGFDRLLSSGFTTQEIATLRSQFQQNISYTHTPDTMPSPTELRAMEDRWLDSTANDPSTALGATGETEAGWGAGFTVEEGGLDDMIWGYLIGFFWPLAAVVWGFREEGVWPRRRQLAVVMGVVLNAAFGFLRWSS